MAIYEILPDRIREIEGTTFLQTGLKERQDLQRLLRNQIEIISPQTLVISEEFGQWDESTRRIDLLGIDKNANLVVIELKRTEDGGHMELQAIRYAAMVSTMKFDRAVDFYSDYLLSQGVETDARTSLLEFLEWDEPKEDIFAQDVRIVLVAAEFSKELTTAVIWLNDHDLDIRCIRIKPYRDGSRILADVQQIIPLPEETEYRVSLKEKQQSERVARRFNPDFTKYNVTVDGVIHERLPKRTAIFTVVRFLISRGHSPEEIAAAVPSRQRAMFRSVDGVVDCNGFCIAQNQELASLGRVFERRRFFCADGELFHLNGRTYAFTNQWGDGCIEAIKQLIDAFSSESIQCDAASI